MPDWKGALASRLASLRLSPAREHEIVEELSQHLDDIYGERRAAGAPPDEAIRGALDELDESDLLTREMQPLAQSRHIPPPVPGAPRSHWLSDAAQDIAYAGRTLLHARGWTLVIVSLLALGIGANTALFRATDALLFSSLPVEDPDSLVRLRWTGRNDAVTERSEYGYVKPLPDGRRPGVTFSYAAFNDLRRNATDMVELFACAPIGQVTAVVDGRAELARALAATGNYFGVLGISARLGRVFTPDDERPEAPQVAVLSSRYWQARFGADPSAVGRVVKVNDVPLTIVGVMPHEFTGVQQTLADPPDIVYPLALEAQVKASTGRTDASLLSQPTAWWIQVMGRLRPGATAAQVQAKLDGVFQETARSSLAGYLQSLSEEQRGTARNRQRRDVPQLLVEPGSRGAYDVEEDVRTTANILSAVVAVILLIICANVANLMLSRATGRRKEISVRMSLGATRGRLVRQLFTEALLLAAAGAGLGMLVAYYGVRLLPAPASSVNVFDGRALAFAALAAVLTSLFFGALPALRATDVDVNAGLKESARSIAGRRSILARTLLVVQVALSLVLLVGAGLFLQTVHELRRVDVGFDSDNLLLVRISPRLGGYDQPRATDLYRTLLERLEAIPGVRGVALSQPALLSGSISSTDIYVHGRPAPPARSEDREDREIYRLVVSPGFFDVMGIPIVRGRALTDRDDRSAPQVAIINEAAARKYFPGEDPLGKRFGSQPDRTSDVEVVGVVKDSKYASLREPAPPTMYVTYLQAPRALAVFEVRTDGSPLALAGSVREVVRQIDPDLPVADIATQKQHIERRFARERLFAQAYGLFGAIALVLASIGLFGLMSYNVARRTSEMGIRMALGAQRLDVIRLVMRESLLLVGVGLAAGVIIALVSGRLVAALLFSVPAHDVWTLLGTLAVMTLVSALAAYLPARRAARVDPIVALRYE